MDAKRDSITDVDLSPPQAGCYFDIGEWEEVLLDCWFPLSRDACRSCERLE